MFVESSCISTSMDLRYHKYIYFERSSFCLSTDISFTSLALISVKIYILTSRKNASSKNKRKYLLD